MPSSEKEYLMLRTEIENNLKRQEAFFLIIFTILSVVNSINQDFWNYEILLLISAFILFLQLKIIKSRNEVKIISRLIASILYILNFIWFYKNLL